MSVQSQNRMSTKSLPNSPSLKIKSMNRSFFGNTSYSQNVYKLCSKERMDLVDEKSKQIELNQEIQSLQNRINMISRNQQYTEKTNQKLLDMAKNMYRNQQVKREKILNEIEHNLRIKEEEYVLAQQAKQQQVILRNSLLESNYQSYLQKQREHEEVKTFMQKQFDIIHMNKQQDILSKKIMINEAKQIKQQKQQQRQQFLFNQRQKHLQSLRSNLKDKQLNRTEVQYFARTLQKQEMSSLQKLSQTQNDQAQFMMLKNTQANNRILRNQIGEYFIKEFRSLGTEQLAYLKDQMSTQLNIKPVQLHQIRENTQENQENIQPNV